MLIIADIMNSGSDIVTNGIRIKVYPQYIPEKQTPGDGRNYFAYTVIITNTSNQWVKLLSRHWIIINSEGDKEEITGEGVVGYFPELNQGDSFTYTSYCPINTEWGTMEGEYQFITKDGTILIAEIGRFFLISPQKAEMVDL